MRITGSFLPKLLLCIKITLILPMISTFHMAMGQQGQAPTSGNQTTSKPLRIAVPVKVGFTEFLNVERDPVTKEPTFNGFSIDIFKTVINDAMPYTIKFDFIPFTKPDGTMNGSYDDMLKAVSNKEYDAAVGDISIRYYRTQWVDFTLPYSESGVSLLVPLQSHRITNSRGTISTQLANGLVGATVASCFILALLFWFKEYRNDRAHLALDRGDRGMLRTRLVIVLCFLVLVVLTTCFIALLITLLNGQRPAPPVASINDLVRKGNNVGVSKVSFVRHYLTQRGFKDSQLKNYSSVGEMHDLLSKGTAHGGVDAVIGETPYLKLFLTQYCNAYTLVPSASFQGDGFGFAFQKDSPLVRDISDAILKVTNNDDQLTKIRDRTIGDLDTCRFDLNNDINLIDWSHTLRILIIGAVGVVALMFIVCLVYFGSNDLPGLGRWSPFAYPCYFCCSVPTAPADPVHGD